MVSPDPVNTPGDGARSTIVAAAGEVPLRAGGRDHEHCATHNEGIEPEVAEE